MDFFNKKCLDGSLLREQAACDPMCSWFRALPFGLPPTQDSSHLNEGLGWDSLHKNDINPGGDWVTGILGGGYSSNLYLAFSNS